jgi:hypothetical protein
MAKPKKIAYELIPEAEHPEMYELLRDLIAGAHDHLIGANIGLAWALSWKPNVDGQLVLGKCKKASDLDRLLHGLDFVIILNRAAWNVKGFAEHQEALLFHELCHAEVAIDPDSGDPVYDTAGHQVFRTRKHDIEEFQSVVARYGCWKKELEEFARAALKREKAPLFRDQDPEATVSVSFAGQTPIELGPMSSSKALQKMARSVRKTKESQQAN